MHWGSSNVSNTIKVGISDQNIARAPDILVPFALGSCVGICLYDSRIKLGGLSHILLPDSSAQSPLTTPYRFADSAIPLLLRRMESMGAKRAFIKAKIAGGAQMFAATNNASLSHIGQRNVQAVRQALRSLGIPVIADDTGKNFGRTLYFHTDTGTMRIQSATMGEWML